MASSGSKPRQGPPDGGWSWAVLASAFTIAAILLGMGKANGILYTALPTAFDINRSTTASLTSVNSFVRCIMGPVSGALCSRFSSRQVVATAGILSGSGLVIAAYAPNLAVFIVGYCLIFGIGSGLTMVPSKLAINKYFNKKRNLALGLTFTGNCVGGMAMPPLIEALFQTYGLHGLLLMMGGILLHIIPCALVYFPLPSTNQTKKNISASTDTIQTIAGSTNQLNSNSEVKNLRKSVLTTNTTTLSVSVVNGVNSSNPKLPSSTSDTNGTVRNTLIDRQVSVSVAECPHHAKDVNRKPCCQSMDLSLLKNGYYLLIAFTACSPGLAYSIYILVMPDYALQETDDDIQRPQAALLLTMMSAGDFFGRLISSYIGNQKRIPLKFAFTTGLLLMGSTILLLPLVRFYVGLMCFSALFGMTAGITLVMPTFLINEYIPSEMWPTAYGFSFFFLGVPILILAPVIGFLRDYTGSYVVCFWLIACITAVGAIAWIVEIIIDQNRKRKIFEVSSEIANNKLSHHDDIVRL